MEQMARAVIKKMCRVSDVKTDMLTDKPSTGYLFDIFDFLTEKKSVVKGVCSVRSQPQLVQIDVLRRRSGSPLRIDQAGKIKPNEGAKRGISEHEGSLYAMEAAVGTSRAPLWQSKIIPSSI